MQSLKKKTYEFTLLKRQKTHLRLDFAIVNFITAYMCWQFGWQMTDKENLLATGCLILAIVFNGVLLLLNKWSVAAHEIFAYRFLKHQ